MLRNSCKSLAEVISVLMLCILLQGCGSEKGQQLPSEPGGGPGFPVTITDDLGREVTVEKAPRRIVSLAPVNTEILFALGLGDRVVGVTKFCDYPAEAREKPKIGGFSNPSVELITAQRPDLVLGTKMHKNLVNQLEKAGLVVVVLEAERLEDVLKNITIVGKITGSVQEAEQIVSNMQERIDVLTAKLKEISGEQKPTVYFEIWPDPPTTGGAGSFLDSLINAAGGKNVAGDIQKDWVTLNPEVLIEKSPDVIIFSHHGSSGQTVEEFKERKGWEQVAAIKAGRVYLIENPDLVEIPGPRVIKGLEIMARYIHPELFD